MRQVFYLSALTAAWILTPAQAALTPAQATEAARLLSSSEPTDRASAVKTVRGQGVSVHKAYLPLLEKAQSVHQERLETSISEGLSVLKKFAQAQEEWVTARDACLLTVFEKTGKDSQKLVGLGSSYAAADKAMQDVSRSMEIPPGSLTVWRDPAAALNELDAEIHWCLNTTESQQNPWRGQSAEERAGKIPNGPEFLRMTGIYQERLGARTAMEMVKHFNGKEIRWSTPELTAFMELINSRRYTLGQETLRLDERLSRSAYGHSEAMQRLEFFSHQSPIEGHKTPWDRAKKAEFEGTCTGENIYMGSTAPEAAYKAWWESDGHRFIMFKKDVNTLGLGVAGNYWTLNIGQRIWP